MTSTTMTFGLPVLAGRDAAELSPAMLRRTAMRQRPLATCPPVPGDAQAAGANESLGTGPLGTGSFGAGPLGAESFGAGHVGTGHLRVLAVEPNPVAEPAVAQPAMTELDVVKPAVVDAALGCFPVLSYVANRTAVPMSFAIGGGTRSGPSTWSPPV